MRIILATLRCEKDCKTECLSLFVVVYNCVFALSGMTQQKWEGKTFSDHSFFTMKVPASVAAVSCLCPLVVFLCVVYQSCYGTRVSLNPLTNPSPDLDANPWLKSPPEPTTFPISSPEKPPLQSSHFSTFSTSSQKSQLKPRFGTMSNLTDNHRSNKIFSSTLTQATSSSNTGVKLQPMTKQSSNSKQRANPKPSVGSLLQPKPKVSAKSATKLSSVSGPYQRSNSSGTMNPNTYSNVSLASLSGFKSPKLRPSSQPGIDAKSKIFNLYSRSSIRAHRNQTKLLEIYKDSHHQPKRGWIWNQFFVLEGHIGPDPQYVGKVRYIYSFFACSHFRFTFFFLFGPCI